MAFNEPTDFAVEILYSLMQWLFLSFTLLWLRLFFRFFFFLTFLRRTTFSRVPQRFSFYERPQLQKTSVQHRTHHPP